MSLPATLSAAVLGTIVDRLASLFLSGAAGDIQAAREAARDMLASYEPQTPYQLRLAAQAIIFSFHALEALSQASSPDMPVTKVLRLRGSAVSLSRESHKAERRLDQLRNARRQGAAAPEPEEVEPTPKRVENAMALVEATRHTTRSAVTATAPSRSKPEVQRQAAPRPDARHDPSLILPAATPQARQASHHL